MKNSKGIAIQELGALVLAFVVVAIMIGIGGTILTQVQSTQCATGGTYNTSSGLCMSGGSSTNTTTIAYNSTGYGLTGVSTFGQWLPTIAVIIAAAAIIGVIVQYFR